MAQQNTNPPRGMRDFLPADVRRREYVIGIIKDVYQKYGFEPLETPAVENLETLLGKYGEEGNQLIYKILKRGEGERTGEADLALRYDLTVPLARVVANYKNELPKFFKRYQIQPVWRADRPARGRFREFYQCDVDAIGSKSLIVEAELISAVCEVLQRLGFNDFVIRVNHRKLLTGILNSINIPNEKQSDALVALDKLDKIGSEGVFKELINRGINEANAEQFLSFFETLHARYERLQNTFLYNLRELITLAKHIGTNENTDIAVDELYKLGELLETISLDKKVKLDASLARGLSYYTGAIFEINVPDLAGSLGGGGRYDGLIGMFGKEEIPACGFSLGLERILVVMNERGMFPEHLTKTAADVLVTIWNEETIADSLELANDLRAQGLRVAVYPEADKLGKQFKYASSLAIPAVAVLGDDERANGTVTIKYLETGTQETISRENLATELKV
ncbi:MAG TPA: histidine--tRNA ligase [Pyrinomonadaceae bacterium]|jgi:histidyl-tRNA synthetase